MATATVTHDRGICLEANGTHGPTFARIPFVMVKPIGRSFHRTQSREGHAIEAARWPVGWVICVGPMRALSLAFDGARMLLLDSAGAKGVLFPLVGCGHSDYVFGEVTERVLDVILP